MYFLECNKKISHGKGTNVLLWKKKGTGNKATTEAFQVIFCRFFLCDLIVSRKLPPPLSHAMKSGLNVAKSETATRIHEISVGGEKCYFF